MIRRTSTVLQALLPAKVEQVVFCKMSPLQLKLYNHFLESPAVRSTLAGEAQRQAGNLGHMEDWALHLLALLPAVGA
jgi:DNA repair and recombination RAD54-like protein